MCKLNTIPTIAASLLFSILFFKPTTLGQFLTPLGLFFLIVTFILYILQSKSKLKYSYKAEFILILFYYFYIFSISILFKESNITWLMKDLISNIIFISIIFLILSNDGIKIKFIEYILKFFSFLGYSNLITYFLGKFFGFHLLLFSLDYTYHVPAYFYFPFSQVYGSFFDINPVFVRFSSMFREAGIASAYLSTLIIFGIRFKYSPYILYGLFFGLILTFSTFMPIFVAIILLYFFKKNINNKKILRLLFLSPLIILVCFYLIDLFINNEGIGFIHKLEVARSSFSSRFTNIFNFNFYSIIGTGVYVENQTMVNLIQSIKSFGLVGFIIQLLLLFNFKKIINGKLNLEDIYMFFPITLTILFLQPIFANPITYLFLILFNYEKQNQ